MTDDTTTNPAPGLSVAIRTLTFAGYALERVDRKPGYAIVIMRRVDEFGTIHRNCFAISEILKLQMPRNGIHAGAA